MHHSHIVFQFQYGAIKTKMPSKFVGVESMFQFQYGAIKTSLGKQMDRFVKVSIPIWCD